MRDVAMPEAGQMLHRKPGTAGVVGNDACRVQTVNCFASQHDGRAATAAKDFGRQGAVKDDQPVRM